MTSKDAADRRRKSSAGRPHVVLIHRYFAPDTPPYATILRGIAHGLARGGMEVEVLTCQPSYNQAVVRDAPARERIGEHITVTRWHVIPDRSSGVAKLANLVVFGARVILRLATMPRVDVVMAASTPPVLVAMLASVIARLRKSRFVYHNQDIYPEVAQVVGQLPTAVVSLLRRIDTATDRRADRVVVLSRDMAQTIEDRGINPDSLAVINNFDPWTIPEENRANRYRPVDKSIRFVYAGNLGKFQNLESVARLIAELGNDERFRFDFIGDGALGPWLQRFVADHQLRNVHLRGYLSPEALADRLQTQYDVGIVSLHPGVIRCAYPSKVMSYIRNGLPVLALVEQDTELVEVLDRYKAGWAANPADPAGVRRTLDGLWHDREQLAVMRDDARRMYETEFGQPGQISSWIRIFDDLVGGLR